MRKSTAIVATLVAASSLAISLRVGELSTLSAIDISSSGNSNPVPSTTPTLGGATPAPGGATPAPGATTPPAAAQPGTPSPVNPPTTLPAVQVTVNSDVIAYKYGNVQISITKTDGLISSVTMLQGDATNGRADAYKILTDATIQVQGTSYGNVSGATFTTDAFKLAVESALAKF